MAKPKTLAKWLQVLVTSFCCRLLQALSYQLLVLLVVRLAAPDLTLAMNTYACRGDASTPAHTGAHQV